MVQTALAGEASVAQGYSSCRKSPAALAATIGIHIMIAGAIIVMPGVQIIPPDIWDPIETTHIPLDPVPPPVEPQNDIKASPSQRAQAKSAETIVKTPLEPRGPILAHNEFGDTIFPIEPDISIPPVSTPVFVQAAVDPRYARSFQPEYPGAMIRADMEGFVTIRVFIDDKGRVTAAELVDATDTAFWKATRKQALEHWRFTPATRDDMPVPSERVMTVRFRLDAIR